MSRISSSEEQNASDISSSGEQDASLYVSWFKNIDDQNSELKSVESINSKNMRKFYEMRDSIIRSSYEIHHPIGRGACEEMKNQFLQEADNNVNVLQQCHTEYNSLVTQEAELKSKIENLKMKLGDLRAKTKQSENDKAVYKKTLSQKLIVSSALKIYERAFGMKVSVDEETQGNVLVATVNFNQEQNCGIRFQIDSNTCRIIDFDAGNLLSKDDADKLKTEFRQSKNVHALVCALKQLPR